MLPRTTVRGWARGARVTLPQAGLTSVSEQVGRMKGSATMGPSLQPLAVCVEGSPRAHPFLGKQAQG